MSKITITLVVEVDSDVWSEMKDELKEAANSYGEIISMVATNVPSTIDLK